MTEQQRAEIERLLLLVLSETEAEMAWRRPQSFLQGGYIQNHPRETIEFLQFVADGLN